MNVPAIEGGDYNARQKLKSLLLEGLESEATEMTDNDWDELRRQYDERHARGVK